MFILYVSDQQTSRDWGDLAGYCLDADGYVLGFAAPIASGAFD